MEIPNDARMDVAAVEHHCRRRDQALARVRALLIASLDLRRAPDEIDPDTALFGTGLGLDSVDAVEIIIALETEFNVKISDESLRRSVLVSVSSLVDAVMTADSTAGVVPQEGA
ncbi:MAG TPA: phosphopantetheine-binding protein [Polyangia bacterium]